MDDLAEEGSSVEEINAKIRELDVLIAGREDEQVQQESEKTRSALISQRKYYRKKLRMASLLEEKRTWMERNATAKAENTRLICLVNQATQLVHQIEAINSTGQSTSVHLQTASLMRSDAGSSQIPHIGNLRSGQSPLEQFLLGQAGGNATGTTNSTSLAHLDNASLTRASINEELLRNTVHSSLLQNAQIESFRTTQNQQIYQPILGAAHLLPSQQQFLTSTHTNATTNAGLLSMAGFSQPQQTLLMRQALADNQRRLLLSQQVMASSPSISSSSLVGPAPQQHGILRPSTNASLAAVMPSSQQQFGIVSQPHQPLSSLSRQLHSSRQQVQQRTRLAATSSPSSQLTNTNDQPGTPKHPPN